MAAHRIWLIEYTDYNINVNDYFYPELINSLNVKITELKLIINKIQEVEK